MRSDSVYLSILEMYLCLFLPSECSATHRLVYVLPTIVDADEFRLLLMPTSSASTSNVLSTTHVNDSRLLPSTPLEVTPK
jgi:hypothetical protein